VLAVNRSARAFGNQTNTIPEDPCRETEVAGNNRRTGR
jgi:hypothetical protein